MGIADRIRRAAGELIGEPVAPAGAAPTGFGQQVCSTLSEAVRREWLVTDGRGGYAMGTVAGLRTRGYHGLLVVADDPVGRRRLTLAELDVTLVVGTERIRLATHEWPAAVIDPTGYHHLVRFAVDEGVPRWRWTVGAVTLEREVAMVPGRPAVAVVHRLVRAPEPVTVEVTALCAHRDAHGHQSADADLRQEVVARGFVIDGAYRVQGPGFTPMGVWYRSAFLREEAARGGQATEDLWAAGTFSATLAPGETLDVLAWADDLGAPPPPGPQVVADARARDRSLVGGATDAVDALLLRAADQFVVHAATGPAIVAGYPWFGEWGRDSMIALDGLLLATGRVEEARALLRRSAAALHGGLLANTTDSGVPIDNTADATLWFVHAVGRYVASTGDLDLAAELAPALDGIIEHHVHGAAHGIRADLADGLLTQGEEGLALTWMDARIGDWCATPRRGKAVEVNALWVNALGWIRDLNERLDRDPDRWAPLEDSARTSYLARFRNGQGLFDVVDGPDGDDASVRPNQLFAVSLPFGPCSDAEPVLAARRHLLTPLGLRSLAPADPAYRGHHQGDRVARDGAYHQGTVWPWLVGPYVDAATRVGVPAGGVLDTLEQHLGDWGLGSISETADGDAPHAATGCPFQAWSVAEVLRVRRARRH